MTPEEKAGQLNIIAGTQNATDVIPGLPSPEKHMAMIKAGQVAGFLISIIPITSANCSALPWRNRA